jgi:sulfopyruvate decarboxylase subunit beta
VILDNECYGSTGSQCSYASTVDLSRVAEAVGFKNLFLFQNEIDFSEILNINGSIFVHIKIEKGNADVPVIDMEPEDIKIRFIEEIKGKLNTL